MTTMDLETALIGAADTTERRGNFLTRLIGRWRRERAARTALYDLSRLDAHLLRDMGIEPMDVYDALNRKAGPSVLFHPMRPDGK